MYAVATLFDIQANAGVKTLWHLLESTCKLSGIFSTPTPHMTWFGAEELDEIKVVQCIDDVICHVKPFDLRCSGYGVFTNTNPIIYLSLVKTEHLLHVHKLIWEAVYPKLLYPHELYSPENWIPHITLAYGDVDVNNIGCAIRSIVEIDSCVSFQIDNVSLIFNKNENIGVYKTIGLGMTP
ncbi:MAG: 2'-5' RNA ligase family protein [Anaerolineaceae bacterium]|nr:2'-5' RNA ligase family protein [Anaerolineaceae bacterium]